MQMEKPSGEDLAREAAGQGDHGDELVIPREDHDHSADNLDVAAELLQPTRSSIEVAEALLGPPAADDDGDSDGSVTVISEVNRALSETKIIIFDLYDVEDIKKMT